MELGLLERFLNVGFLVLVEVQGDVTLVRRFASWFLAQVGLGLCRAIGSIALSIALRVALAIGGAALCACLLSCRYWLLESDPEKLKFDEDFQAFGSPTCPRADQSSTDSPRVHSAIPSLASAKCYYSVSSCVPLHPLFSSPPPPLPQFQCCWPG